MQPKVSVIIPVVMHSAHVRDTSLNSPRRHITRNSSSHVDDIFGYDIITSAKGSGPR